MWMYYLIACIPTFVGVVLWLTRREIVWWEWAASSALGFLVTAGIHALVMLGMTADTETLSGKVKAVVHHPRWVEEYQQPHTKTVGSGKTQTTVTYYTTEYRTHHEKWSVALDFGHSEEEKDIAQSLFSEISGCLGGKKEPVPGWRPGFYSGDRNDYHVRNRTGYIFPATTTKRFQNRVKCAPSVFSYVTVPETAGVYEYPKNSDWAQSNRLLGTAGQTVRLREWDQMNSRLGPFKKVNVILIGFGHKDASIAQLQEAKWVGGKKNDLVICYGGKNEQPTWAVVFGWTENEQVKRNLETLIIDNAVSNDLLPKIEKEIVANYRIKDWSKFDYISVDPPWWGVLVLIAVMAITQIACIGWALTNEEEKV